MNNNNKSSSQSDFWTVLFNEVTEIVKMILSIIMAIVVAGSKTSSTPSEDKILHAGDRHNNDKSVHFDNDA
ncbi:hypothetical protein ACF5DM_001419 [Salmonella enterica]|uniref:hypothetical protein n=1 Tax=Salmonella enterica TaxID=28901 RepID=UPI00071DF915|nr:hypothetical protein [Salmonella enterica]EAB5862620.1 hypothetical protein [Salmonella enterica subsp. enterica serovar Cairina]EAB6416870.1 hypothetical protein [Salmonella enterica subsp. enterica]EBG0215157.1 hypothetical protein [Salmonella enterica subsp. enterica serovar Louisiana]EBW5580007.1 hypothetical protein [Salmonella enterica subsp. enterica serovar Teddington]EBY8830537.1 hypothetical protein [Salmonella enterica subsp. enterica serovar Schwarzengrund]EBZ0016619.1 hypothet